MAALEAAARAAEAERAQRVPINKERVGFRQERARQKQVGHEKFLVPGCVYILRMYCSIVEHRLCPREGPEKFGGCSAVESLVHSPSRAPGFGMTATACKHWVYGILGLFQEENERRAQEAKALEAKRLQVLEKLAESVPYAEACANAEAKLDHVTGARTTICVGDFR